MKLVISVRIDNQVIIARERVESSSFDYEISFGFFSVVKCFCEERNRTLFCKSPPLDEGEVNGVLSQSLGKFGPQTYTLNVLRPPVVFAASPSVVIFRLQLQQFGINR